VVVTGTQVARGVCIVAAVVTIVTFVLARFGVISGGDGTGQLAMFAALVAIFVSLGDDKSKGQPTSECKSNGKPRSE